MKKIKPKYTKPYEQEEEESSEKPTKEKIKPNNKLLFRQSKIKFGRKNR